MEPPTPDYGREHDLFVWITPKAPQPIKKCRHCEANGATSALRASNIIEEALQMAVTLSKFGLEACIDCLPWAGQAAPCKMRSQWQIAGRGDKDHESVQAFNNASSYLSVILI